MLYQKRRKYIIKNYNENNIAFDISYNIKNIYYKYKKFIIPFIITFLLIFTSVGIYEIKYYYLTSGILSAESDYKYDKLYYNALTHKEQLLYNELIETFNKYGSVTKSLPVHYTYEEYEKVIKFLLADNPVYFFIDLNNCILQSDYYKSKVYISYITTPDVINKMKDELDNIINELSETVSDFDNDEKLLYIHDYIVTKTSHAKEWEDDYIYNTAYGALMMNKAFSGGYSTAFKIILDNIGVYNCIVFGKADNTEHIWNIVYINDKFYHMDIAWNDAEFYFAPDILFHGYYNVNDSVILQDHTIDYYDILPKSFDNRTYYDIKSLKAENENELDTICHNEILKATEENRNYIELYINYDYNEDDVYNLIKKQINNINDIQNDIKYLDVCRIFYAANNDKAVSVQLFYEDNF